MERKLDEVRTVEITIKGEAKEIAALIMALQERQLPERDFAVVTMKPGERLVLGQSDQIVTMEPVPGIISGHRAKHKT